MTEEQLAKLKAALEVPFEKMPIIPEPANLWRHEAKALVAEVERLRTEAAHADEYTSQLIEEHRAVMEQNDALLAEVERLRHQLREEQTARINAVADLQDEMAHRKREEDENAAMREIVQQVADNKGFVRSGCFLCGAATLGWTDDMVHTDDCPVIKARSISEQTT